MRFELSFEANVDSGDSIIRFIVMSNNTMPVATSMSPAFEIEAGKKYRYNITLPLNGLAPGEYSMKLQIGEGKIGGRTTVLDQVDDAGKFIIADDPSKNHGFVWNEPVWGSVHLGSMTLEEAK